MSNNSFSFAKNDKSIVYDRSSRYSLSSNPNQSKYYQNMQQQQTNQYINDSNVKLKSHSPLSGATLFSGSNVSSASPISTSSVVSTSSSTNASKDDAFSSTNTITNRNLLTGSNATIMPSTPTKTSPFLFSKYIESVHKALHGGVSSLAGGNNVEQQQQDNMTLNDELNYSFNSNQSMPRRLVEHRRQLFEKPQPVSLSRTSSLRQSDDSKELTPLAEKSPFYFNNNNNNNNNNSNYFVYNQRADNLNENSNEISNKQFLHQENLSKKSTSHQMQNNSSRASSIG